MFAATAPGASADAQERDAVGPVGPQLQAILDRAVRAPEATFPGVALHVRGPGIASWSGAAGHAEIPSARRMRAGDRFRAGSIMKPLVAAATLQLVEERKIGLEDPLPTVLPPRVLARFPDADRITVRMLLNHTSGLGEYNSAAFKGEVLADPRRQWTVSELLDARPRFREPGPPASASPTPTQLQPARPRP